MGRCRDLGPFHPVPYPVRRAGMVLVFLLLFLYLADTAKGIKQMSFWKPEYATIGGLGDPTARYPQGEHMTGFQSKQAFIDRIAALPEKERDAFWRGIMAIVDAGVKTGTSAKEMAGYWGAYFKEVDQHREENT